MVEWRLMPERVDLTRPAIRRHADKIRTVSLEQIEELFGAKLQCRSRLRLWSVPPGISVFLSREPSLHGINHLARALLG